MSSSLRDLTVLQTIFGIFFAIFWGATAAAQSRFKPFGWLNRVRYDFCRIGLSLVLLNFVPIIYFFLAFLALGSRSPILGSWTGFLMVLLVVFVAIGVIGFYRIWVAIIQCSAGLFYAPDSLCRLRRNGMDMDFDPELACGNFLWGIIFLVPWLAFIASLWLALVFPVCLLILILCPQPETPARGGEAPPQNVP
jgi:hypothetical protein